MIPEGQLHIRLGWDGMAIRQVEIAPRRLADVARLLHGKAPRQAVAVVPLLFSVCGRAQGVAAALAVDAAQGKTGIATAQRRAVLAEAFQESAWRFLIDLPRRYALPADVAALAALRKLCASELPAAELADRLELFLSQQVLGEPVGEWRLRTNLGAVWPDHSPHAEVFRRLGDDGDWGGGNIPQLVDFSAAQMVEGILPALLGQADFASLPSWRGIPAETGPLARSGGGGGNAIAARFLARLTELARLPEALRGSDTLSSTWIKQAQVAENVGMAWLQTARGLLIHYARVEGEAVTDYRIVAPTEWNFHPQGAYAQGLAGKAADSREAARRHAELLLLALDPCVGFEIEVDHA